MVRFAFAPLVLAGCLSNPTVAVDKQSVDVPRGAATDLLVTLDGSPVANLDEVLWSVEDEQLVTVTPSSDGYHLRVGGNYEGETIVHVSSHGQHVAIPARVGPPAILLIWTEPTRVDVTQGSELYLTAKSLDTLAQIEDITYTSRWRIRDERVVSLDHSGMMLHAMDAGETTIHVSHGSSTTVVPVAVFK